jgi:hypothetical protein
VKRGRHIPEITFTVETASNTQSDFHSASSVAASVAGSTSWAKAQALNSDSSFIGP